MTLQKKITLIFAVSYVSLVSVLYFVANRIVMESYLNMEVRSVAKNVSRAESALQGEIARLDAIGGDWAPWNETRDFVLGKNEDYVKDNLISTTLTNLKVNLMIFIDASGHILYTTGVDLTTGKYAAPPLSLRKHIEINNTLLHHKSPMNSKKGLILLPEAPLLIASWPITNNNFQKPINGTLIIGKYLNAPEIKKLKQQTKLSIYFERLDKSPLPNDFEKTRTKSSRPKPIEVKPLNSEIVAGYRNVEDIYGNPCITLKVEMKREIYKQGKESVDYFLLAIIYIGATILLVLILFLRKIVVNPIANLKQHILTIKDSGNLSLQFSQGGKDEIGVLTNEFNLMVANVAEKSAALSMANEKLGLDISKRKLAEDQLKETNLKLQKSIAHIKEAQAQLVQSEKLASLGGLVAGVAHEINTPLGVAITASSFLQELAKEAIENNRHGFSAQKEMHRFLTRLLEASDLVFNNLDRVAELVYSFKQLSVDQTSDNKRWFDLKNYFELLLISLKPKYERANHRIVVNCSEELRIYSHPGIFSQIITNLVMNSIIHGFEDMDGGEIEINISFENNHLVISYTDNGKGMDIETREKMFDPFFTTKRSQGGTGLGMHILYNLVTQTLRGMMDCTSRIGEGIVVLMRVPLSEKDVRY